MMLVTREERPSVTVVVSWCRWERPGGYLVAGNRRDFIQIIIPGLTQHVIIVNEHITSQPASLHTAQCSVYKYKH